MGEQKPLIDSACQNCPPRWCCSTRYFPSPPLCMNEIMRIRQAGYSEFYQKANGQHRLRIRSDGYCVFFDNKLNICKIYQIRPFDCRIFPFDFITGKGEGFWVLYDCPYSRQMNRTEIELILTDFEQRYASEILETWDCDDEVFQPPAKEFRIIRKIGIRPPLPGSCDLISNYT